MLLIKTTTDNKNRTLGEIKTILTKNGGRFGEAGSSMWNFEQVGKIAIKIEDKKDIERIEIEAIEAGAKDIQQENDLLNVYTEVKDLQKVQECLTDKNLPISEISLSYLPKNILRIDEKTRLTYEKLLDALSEQDDTEEVFDNL